MSTGENIQALISQTLRNRIMATYALCAVAESEVHAGELERACQTVKAIRRMLSDINILVCTPADRPCSSAIHEAAEMLAELENRTQTIEQSIGPSRQFH